MFLSNHICASGSKTHVPGRHRGGGRPDQLQPHPSARSVRGLVGILFAHGIGANPVSL